MDVDGMDAVTMDAEKLELLEGVDGVSSDDDASSISPSDSASASHQQLVAEEEEGPWRPSFEYEDLHEKQGLSTRVLEGLNIPPSLVTPMAREIGVEDFQSNSSSSSSLTQSNAAHAAAAPTPAASAATYGVSEPREANASFSQQTAQCNAATSAEEQPGIVTRALSQVLSTAMILSHLGVKPAAFSSVERATHDTNALLNAHQLQRVTEQQQALFVRIHAAQVARKAIDDMQQQRTDELRQYLDEVWECR